MNAQNIVERLREKGWSDNAIARAIGRPQPTVSRIGNGQTDPRESIVRELEALARKECVYAIPPSPRLRTGSPPHSPAAGGDGMSEEQDFLAAV